MSREHGRAGRPVALAQQIAGRVPSLVLAQEAADELRQRGRVLVQSPEIAPLRFARRTAEPRADRVDHHDVGDVEERVVVVDQRIRRRRLLPHVRGDDPTRAHDTHVEPEGRGARPSVEGEDQGTGRSISAVRPEIGGIKELAGRVLLGVPQDDAAHDRVVRDRLAPQDDGLARLPPGRLGLAGRIVRSRLRRETGRGAEDDQRQDMDR